MAPALGTRFGEPWPVAGTPQATPEATDRHYTGQRSFEASLGSLYHYQARWYSPVFPAYSLAYNQLHRVVSELRVSHAASSAAHHPADRLW